MKRKNEFANPDASETTEKRARISEEGDEADSQAGKPPAVATSVKGTGKVKDSPSGARASPVRSRMETSEKPLTRRQRRQIRKLAPARPFPLVPTSVSATGPRSAFKEGKNFICITRRTSLGAYLRRCKDVILKDGYKMLHLSAMGAAIPMLLQLSCALPAILPHDKSEISSEVLTGTCEVQDEVQPEDDDEDVDVQSRFKSTLQIVMTIGDGKFEGDTSGPARRTGKAKPTPKVQPRQEKGGPKNQVFLEPEQEDDLMEGV